MLSVALMQLIIEDVKAPDPRASNVWAATVADGCHRRDRVECDGDNQRRDQKQYQETVTRKCQ